MFNKGPDFRVLTAIDQAHIFNTGDFRRETDASRAMDAAGHDRFDQRPMYFSSTARLFSR